MTCRPIKAETYVWCDWHGMIHGNTVDPHGYGLGDEDNCSASHHRPVYVLGEPGEEF